MRIGERLRAARKEREMSLSDLARVTHLSKGFISQVESGASNPSLESLRKLTGALGLAPGAFLDSVHLASVRPGSIGSLSTAQFIAKETITIYSPQFAGRSRGAGIVPIRADGEQGTAALITLAPRETLVASGLDGDAQGMALCAVMFGAVKISRANAVAVIRQGEVASFEPARGYRFDNTAATQTTLLLTLPPGFSLPARPEEAVTTIPLLGLTYPAGPLRIVEMRASRGLASERRR